MSSNCQSCGKEDYDLRHVHIRTKIGTRRQNICEQCEDDYDDYCDKWESSRDDD